jgi:ankyrin repeat protein
MHQNWSAATALLSAHTWLAEVTVTTTQQYLLHVAVSSGIPPDDLVQELLRLHPGAVYKWDVWGNLPLHYAASGTLAAHLGDRFPSGASVRNQDGLLPLHLAVRAGRVTAVPTLARYFGPGLAVSDNQGNLPIHLAAQCPAPDRRDVLEMIDYLLVEADRQVEENGLRFRQKVPKTLEDDETIDTNATKDFEDETSNCLIVRNDMGDTPLSLAIYHTAGWHVIDALTTHSGGLQGLDEHENTALHLVTSADFADPAAALAILRKVPEAVTIHNDHGVLPIEVNDFCFLFLLVISSSHT